MTFGYEYLFLGFIGRSLDRVLMTAPSLFAISLEDAAKIPSPEKSARSPRALWSDQEPLTWVNDVSWAYVVEATELINRDAILTCDPVERVP